MKLLAILTVCSAIGCSGKDEAPLEPILRSVRYTVVEGADASRKRTFSGVIRAGDQSSLSFQVPGRIDAVGVKVGDKVKKGQLIARPATNGSEACTPTATLRNRTWTTPALRTTAPSPRWPRPLKP